jgi:phosphoribosyl 1,2-cyclic phosphodiesterase
MIDDISISPMPVPHDAREPLQYRFDCMDKSIAIMTDLGKITKHVIQKLSRINLLVLEFNHDDEMLKDSDYPTSLKKRINGEYGHLENKESLKLLSSISHSELSWVIAAHLSEKNNKIELVKKMIFEVVDKHNSNVGVIHQDLGLEWIST